MTAPVPAPDRDRETDIFYVGVFCDHGACEADETGDYKAYDRDHAIACLRRDLNAQGWRCDDTGDWCPEHRTAR